jgi:DNA-binding MarR family transcriptional regulator
MSSRLPDTSARGAPENIGVLLREPFLALTEHVHERLAEAGHPEIRPAHGNVFQFLDDEGTRVSDLADRAQMTKQSMAELVAHLEAQGYVERVPDSSDRRAKLVRATRRGRKSYPLALAAIAETEARWTERLGEAKMRRLRKLLEELNAGL